MISFQSPWSSSSWTSPSDGSPLACSESVKFDQSSFTASSYVPESNYLESNCLEPLPVYRCINLSKLSPFERLDDQFLDMGLQVEGAIALQPSNPIFWTRHQAIVLMPTAGRKSIDLIFPQPVHYLSASVIGVREVRLMATTSDRQQVIQRSQTPNRSLQNPSDLLEPFPPSQLEVEGEIFTRARIESSHPFVVSAILYAQG